MNHTRKGHELYNIHQINLSCASLPVQSIVFFLFTVLHVISLITDVRKKSVKEDKKNTATESNFIII